MTIIVRYKILIGIVRPSIWRFDVHCVICVLECVNGLSFYDEVWELVPPGSDAVG